MFYVRLFYAFFVFTPLNRFTPFVNLGPLIFGLMFFGSLVSIYLSLLLKESDLRLFLTPTFSGNTTMG